MVRTLLALLARTSAISCPMLDSTDHLTAPLKLASAWRGAELLDDGGWQTLLRDDVVGELRAAARTASALVADGRKTRFELTRADFPLPSVPALGQRIRAELEGGRGFVLLRGVPLVNAGADDALAAAYTLWALGTHIGTAEPQDATGNLLHEVRDSGRDLASADVRYYQTRRAIGFHNDGADVFMLLCVVTAESGGRSRIVSSVAAFNEVLQRDVGAARILQQPFYFDLRGEQAPGQPPFQVVPICNYYAGRLSTLYKRGYIEMAERLPGVPPLAREQRAALDLYDEVCDELAYEFAMQPGDLLIGNNYDVLHARSEFAETAGGPSERLMLRLWLSITNARSLPPAFAATREFRHSYARHQAYG